MALGRQALSRVWNRRTILPIVVYGLLALVVMGPLLRRGFVFALDMVFAPHITPPSGATSSYPFYVVLGAADDIVPSDVIQKVLLLTILLLSGLGAHKMVLYAFERGNISYPAWTVYMAGLLYMVNPYTYGRFLAGQFAVLLGYSLLPWLARSVLVLTAKPDWLAALRVAVWIVVIGIVLVHTLGLAIVIVVAAVCVELWQSHNKIKPWRLLGSTLLVFLGVTAGSSYWLIPAIQGDGNINRQVDGFSQVDRQAFATVSGQWGSELNVLSLQGFWLEGTDLMLLPHDVWSLWWLGTIVLWVMVVVGVVYAFRQQQDLAIFFTGIAVIGWVLALGSAGTGVADLNDWLARHMPFFAGYREPHKFTGLVAVSYVYFTTLALANNYDRINALRKPFKQLWYGFLVPLLLLPLLLAPQMPWGFNGQLQSRQYPADWFTMNDYLNNQPGNFAVLSLPWHLYMHYEFAGRIIANPMPQFFNKTMVVSTNPEIGSIEPRPTAQTGTLLEPYVLPNGPRHADLARELASHNIRYILLAKEYDYHNYSYLNELPNIILVQQTSHLLLYGIKL